MYPQSQPQHPTELKCAYQPDTDTVLIYQHGKGGIKVLNVPVDDLAAALAEKSQSHSA